MDPKIIQLFSPDQKITILTGAGVSAESGVPTFRDAQTGLWANFKPEEVATPEAFEANPKMVWEWYQYRRDLLKAVKPNPGHVALAEMEDIFPKFTLITQNIDGLHQVAGNRHIIELHGNLSRNKCFEADHPVEQWEDSSQVPPRCPTCGGRVRPDVVWFGEMLAPQVLEAAFEAAQDCDLFLTIGTSSVVEPAASLSWEALRSGATVIEINPDPTPLTPEVHHFLRGPSGEILPALLESLRKSM